MLFSYDGRDFKTLTDNDFEMFLRVVDNLIHKTTTRTFRKLHKELDDEYKERNGGISLFDMDLVRLHLRVDLIKRRI